MTEESKLSLDDIVTIELEGKSAAISGYDEILWKIRSGYASILYGSVAVLSALVNKEVLTFGSLYIIMRDRIISARLPSLLLVH